MKLKARVETDLGGTRLAVGRERLVLVRERDAFPEKSFLLLSPEAGRALGRCLADLALPGKGPLREEALEALEQVRRLLSRDEEGLLREGPFRLAKGRWRWLVWNAEDHPMSPLLELLPEGGRYRGELPGYPKAILEAEVDGNGKPLPVLWPLGLQVGPLLLRPEKERPLPLPETWPEEVLEAYRVPTYLWGLLSGGEVERAAKELTLSALEGV